LDQASPGGRIARLGERLDEEFCRRPAEHGLKRPPSCSATLGAQIFSALPKV
jgi:hypothetical protein